MEKRTERGEGIVRLAGMPLALHYTVNGMCALEALAGKPIDRLLDMHFSATRLLLWAGLHDAHPDMTVRDAGNLIGEHLLQGGSLEDIAQACADGLRAAGLMGDPRAPEDSGGEEP